MSYQAKRIYLLEPLNGTPEVSKAMDSFWSYWLTLHSSADSLVLHHYTTLDGLQGILQSRSIWCSHVSSLNDPLELQYGKRLVIANLNDAIEKEGDKDIKHLLKNVITDIEAFDTVLYDPFVACFCESDNLLSQWRGYAARGGGYNLGISFDSDTKFCHNSVNPSDDSYLMLRKVIYCPNDQTKIVSRFISEIIQGSKNAIDKWIQRKEEIPDTWTYQAAMESANILYDIILSFKNPVFSEEKEWRLIKIMAKNHKPDLLRFRETSEGLVPYLLTFIYEKLKGTLNFPLRTIRFGPMLDEVRTKAALELFLNNKAKVLNPIRIDPIEVKILGAGYILRR